MIKIKILLKTTDDIKRFVYIVNKFPYKLDLVDGNYRIDGKSIMGIFSLRIGVPINCEIYTEKCTDLLEACQEFIVCE